MMNNEHNSANAEMALFERAIANPKNWVWKEINGKGYRVISNKKGEVFRLSSNPVGRYKIIIDGKEIDADSIAVKNLLYLVISKYREQLPKEQVKGNNLVLADYMAPFIESVR